MIRSRRLPDPIKKRLETHYLDFFLEKHEMWHGYFARSEDCRIALLGSHDVLLPLSAEELENVEVLDAFMSPDARKMTLYLADHNFDEALPGIVVIAEKLENTGIYVAVFYHASHHVSKLWNERKSTFLMTN
jgi:hypothetical protein